MASVCHWLCRASECNTLMISYPAASYSVSLVLVKVPDTCNQLKQLHVVDCGTSAVAGLLSSVDYWLCVLHLSFLLLQGLCTCASGIVLNGVNSPSAE